ncbi:class I SAM-dependent methyltransferase [Streptomyces sp. G44]|uniref:SAM-dependent methyltransferase n=1 Tax=Streptomyces sp. G44 TaxID=2807632 RepID=UPI0019613150|nr:class I SAM-dependent methyltransferase [Streptomyces sp. G44]MBM7167522.1 class I SAM-dependent methyltransferase [Streptomyces sp. G44]
MFYTKLVSQYQQDSAWFVEHSVPQPSDVLDLCCGGGRSVVELAAAGHRVTGVDLSAVQLVAAEKHAADKGVADRVELLREDITTLNLGRTFNTVVIGGLSLTLFQGPQREALLNTVRTHLAPGGRLLFDHTPVRNGEMEREQVLTLPVKLRERSGFVLVGTRRQPDSATQFTNMYGELIDDTGHTQRYLTGFRFRIDSQAQVAKELAAAGLAVREVHDDPMTATEGKASPFATRQYVIVEQASR